ncbi:MAG: glycosyltransferase family protein [Anaerolineales bacterium]|nr:glycosyltransferase family protein [Anaerolineales bacterium]
MTNPPKNFPEKPKILAIIQARLASSRLPGKVLLDIGGKPMLTRVVERASQSKLVDQVVVAITRDYQDDILADYCISHKYPSFRGSQFDVLDRVYRAARAYGGEVIVRLTADCPLIDPQVIDDTVLAFFGQKAIPEGEEIPQGYFQLDNAYDFAANRLPPPWKRTYPIGLDVEVCSYAGLERAWKEANQPHQREHVMPFFYETPGQFNIFVLDHTPDYGTHRWTVDTAEDLALVREIYQRFDNRDDFSWEDVLALFEKEPQLAEINAQVHHKNLREIDSRQ